MHTGIGHIVELSLQGDWLQARLKCAANLVPGPGQYLLASRTDQEFPVPIFYTDSAPEGFMIAHPFPENWLPGQTLALRGPLGRGFDLAPITHKLALIAKTDTPVRLLGLIGLAFKRQSEVVLLTDQPADYLPSQVEVQPLSALSDVFAWADFLACDVLIDDVADLKLQFRNLEALNPQLMATSPGTRGSVQLLVRTSMPCGGLAECGICALRTSSSWKRACVDGPVFDLQDLK